jgi:hypothetical protein
MEEARVPGENHRPCSTDKLNHLRCESNAPFIALYKAGLEPTQFVSCEKMPLFYYQGMDADTP